MIFFMSKGGREGESVSILGKAGHTSSPKMTQKKPFDFRISQYYFKNRGTLPLS